MQALACGEGKYALFLKCLLACIHRVLKDALSELCVLVHEFNPHLRNTESTFKWLKSLTSEQTNQQFSCRARCRGLQQRGFASAVIRLEKGSASSDGGRVATRTGFWEEWLPELDLTLLAKRQGAFADKRSRDAIFPSPEMKVLEAKISVYYHVCSPLFHDLACLCREHCSCLLG